MEQIRRIVKTEDGSDTLFNDTLNEHYHSIHGAIAESMHIFIQSALVEKQKEKHLTSIDILEIGMGTGLNVLLTYMHRKNLNISYTAIEAYPLPYELISTLNYTQTLQQPNLLPIFHQIHSNCEQEVLHETFILHKIFNKLESISFANNQFDVIYYDAFSPETQPELWTEEQLGNVAQLLKPNGILTTYCAKGNVRRSLIQAGLQVERIPGPPGKREILRARNL